MALPTQPFAGGGGYGPTMAPGYLEMAGREAERITQERNQRNDAAFNAVGGLLGRFSGMDASEAQAMFPSALGQYYAQSSELDKKSNAMKKMLEVNPELFGLSQDQAKQLGNVTSKMSSTERHAFFQDYVPTLFKAQQAKAEQAGALNKIVTGAFASEAARLTGTPSSPSMVVPSETGAGIISPAPVAPAPVPAIPMQPVSPAAQAPNSWLNYRPKKRVVIE